MISDFGKMPLGRYKPANFGRDESARKSLAKSVAQLEMPHRVAAQPVMGLRRSQHQNAWTGRAAAVNEPDLNNSSSRRVPCRLPIAFWSIKEPLWREIVQRTTLSHGCTRFL